MQTPKFLIALCCLLAAFVGSQAQPILTAWEVNNTNLAYYYLGSGMPPTYVLTSTGELADVQRVCYTADTVWIETTGLTDVMGPYLNPGTPTNQEFVWKFPRNPSAASSPVEVPNVFTTGVLINGISIFGNGDATSYDAGSNTNTNTGDGLWNVDAWYGEGISLDTAYGAHVNQDGTYHSHATPFNLYTFPSSTHSPLVGFAFDGYPVYGPYGYNDPMNASSGVSRMESSFQLRSITTRTTLPDGSTSSPPGPNVSATFPLGMYIEDYEYSSGLGDLDEHNGRFCVTPEFPSGTYAYFVSTDVDGQPWFPYYFGTTYYGNVVSSNLDPMNPQTIPTSGVSCATVAVDDAFASNTVQLAPNPATQSTTLSVARGTLGQVQLTDLRGATLRTIQLHGASAELDLRGLPAGMYLLRLTELPSSAVSTHRLVKE
jgi:hypothetical protein